MVNIKVVAIGKIKESFHREEITEFLKRLSRYCKIQVVEVDESKLKEENKKSIIQTLNKEGEGLLKQIKNGDYVFLLDLHGNEMSSEEFACKIDNLISQGKNITFVIGGSYGLSDEVRKAADYLLKLSSMTFTHQMARVIILEQIYRAFKIIKKEAYHK